MPKKNLRGFCAGYVEHQVPINNMILFHLKWWMDTNRFIQGMSIHPPDPNAILFSSLEQRSGRAIVLPPASALVLALALGLVLASASTNVKVFVKVFKASLFPNLITDLIHLWNDDTYWSKILRRTIPTTLGHVKVKVTDRIFMLKFYV